MGRRWVVFCGAAMVAVVLGSGEGPGEGLRADDQWSFGRTRASQDGLQAQGFVSGPWTPGLGREARGLFKTSPRAQGAIIFPGTKWCGPGSLARNYWDLGRLENEDRCCREHDYCPENILAGRCSRGICNPDAFTRSHCTCDERFRRCLQDLRSPAADTIGALYFNVGNVRCFAEDEEGNDLPPVPGDMLENRLQLDDQRPNIRSNLDVWDQRGGIGCSRRPNCRYKFHTQRHYKAAANGDNVIPPAVQTSRSDQLDFNSRQLNVAMPKRSGFGGADRHTAPFLPKVFRHILRSTGIL